MKKFLLLGAAALTAASAMALEPSVINNAQVQAIAPDGSFLVSWMDGAITFINVEDGSVIGRYGSYEEEYSIGHGNFISDSGTCVGSNQYGAAYYKDGKWTQLDFPADAFFCYGQGISKDGKMIVGTLMGAPLTTDDTEIPMQTPVYWELQDDGTYSEMKELPYPVRDFTGRVPQYVTALSVTDDCNTVVGQVEDYSGGSNTLITFTHLADGTWSYTVFNELVNPSNLVFPEYPEDQPEWVNYEDFMTQDEIDDYNDAILSWWEMQDPDMPYPEFLDFMTDEEIEAYEAAKKAYDEAMEEWQKKYDAFDAVLTQCQEEGHSMMFNNLKLSADNKTVFSTTSFIEINPDDEWDVKEINAPMSVNFVTLEPTVMKPSGITVSMVAGDNTILGFTDSRWREAYLYLPGAEDPVTLLEYFRLKGSDTADWIKENMYKDIEIYDWENDTWVLNEDCPITGTPFCNSDLGVIATAVQNIWDVYSDVDIYTYVLPGVPSGVKEVATDKAAFNAKAFRGGRILTDRVADRVTVYDLSGKVMYNAVPRGSVIETGLRSGAYIVKVTSGDETKVIKAIF